MGVASLDHVRCSHCGQERSEKDKGLCSNCGKTEKTYSVHIKGNGLKISGSLSWKHTKEYYKKNYRIHFLVIAITLGSPFIGLFFAGIPGVIAGLIFGLLSYLLGAKAVMKVKEIRHG